MKKMKKIILFVVLMLIIVFILIIGKRYIIVKNILDVENLNANATNYTAISTEILGNETRHIIKKMAGVGYIFENKNKNNDLEFKIIHNEKENKIYSIDFINKKIEIKSTEVDSDSMIFVTYFHEYLNKSFWDELKYAIIWKISEVELNGEKVYYIDNISNHELWINKAEYKVIKRNSKVDNLNEYECYFEADSVTEKDFELPENIEEFEKIIKKM